MKILLKLLNPKSYLGKFSNLTFSNSIKMKKILAIFAILCIFLALQAFMQTSSEPWPVPDKYEKLKNPVKSDSTSLAEGKALWVKHCQSCHGKTGKGDGPTASQLETDSGDFTTEAFKRQSDGALFYKTYEGRKDMPGYKRKIPTEKGFWDLVNYMRAF
jgi:mono/diheme cytochrome c family protein